MLRQNVIKSCYIATIRRPDGTTLRRAIHAESLAAAKLCAKAVAEEEHAKVASVAASE